MNEVEQDIFQGSETDTLILSAFPSSVWAWASEFVAQDGNVQLSWSNNCSKRHLKEKTFFN